MPKEDIVDLMEKYRPLVIQVRKDLPQTTTLEQAGLVPMANPVVGAVVWGWARDRMRRGVIIKIGRKNAMLYLTTESAMKEAKRLYDLHQAADPDRQAEVARDQAAKKWVYNLERSKQVIADEVSDWEAQNICEHVKWTENNPNQAAYIEQQAQQRRAEVIAAKENRAENYVHCTRTSIPMNLLYEQAPIPDERLPERPAMETTRSYVSVEARPKDRTLPPPVGKDTPVTLEIVGRLHVELVMDTPHKMDVLGAGRDIGENHDPEELNPEDPVDAWKLKIWTKIKGGSDAEDLEQATREEAENRRLVEQANPLNRLKTLLQRKHDHYEIARRGRGVSWDDFDDACKEIADEVEVLFGFEPEQSKLRAQRRCPVLTDPDKGSAEYCGQSFDPDCAAGSCTMHHLLVDASEDCCSEY
ncbi:hypothetical protein ABZ897_61790 [Nonomuraea sp. NPDC046802]|uniref:hypothetical protein n=1 Tax=Nonomuraea sp. NPDC046802 TaxID=3154919 RepID=UPI0033CD2846